MGKKIWCKKAEKNLAVLSVETDKPFGTLHLVLRSILSFGYLFLLQIPWELLSRAQTFYLFVFEGEGMI